MTRHSEAHDPAYCDCAPCCDRHDESLILEQERERIEARDRVLDAIEDGGIELARAPYGRDSA